MRFKLIFAESSADDDKNDKTDKGKWQLDLQALMPQDCYQSVFLIREDGTCL